MKLRSFISIELSDELKNRLEEIQGELKRCRTDIRWVKTENIHLTLKFLGNIDEQVVGDIVQVIKAASSDYRSFELVVGSVGVFPHARAPRVLWAGIDENEVLAGLFDKIDRGLVQLGFDKEKRKFAPHLTLGRFKSSRGKEELMKSIPSLRGGGDRHH